PPPRFSLCPYTPLFRSIFALHWMNTPQTARKGVYAGVAGTTLAILVTWAEPTVIHHVWIIGAIALGFVVGVPLSRVPLTAVPQRSEEHTSELQSLTNLL